MKKRYFALLLAALLPFALPGCSPAKDKASSQPASSAVASATAESPKQVAENGLNSLIKLDFKTANQYFVTENDPNAPLFKDADMMSSPTQADSKEILEAFVSDVSYQITDVKEQAETASVTAQVTTRDLSKLADSMKNTNEKKSVADIISGITERKETKVILPLKKINNQWKIVMTKDLDDSIFGDLYSGNMPNDIQKWLNVK